MPLQPMNTARHTFINPSLNRRHLLQSAVLIATGLFHTSRASAADPPRVRIKDIRLSPGVTIEADDGTLGVSAGSPTQNLKALNEHLPKIKELLVGKDPLDLSLCGQTLWDAIYPDKAPLFGEFRDPLSGESTRNKTRSARHTATGRIFIAFSTCDVALWDLRAKLLKRPAYQTMGTANRERLLVYWRPGEVGVAPATARRHAREAFDRGYRIQKWYFSKGAKDGEDGFKDNVELVRQLREELPDATLMFDNHSIRHSDDVDYSLRLCKAVAGFKPFWIEEPICPEHLDGYARIKGETGLPIAGGEHWYTRFAVKPFLEKKCIDFVQSDPFWCGGISEWLEVCKLVASYKGVKVVPHITSPWVAAPHCVASQSEDLCPLLEYNSEGGLKTLDKQMHPLPTGQMAMTMPEAPGVS